MSAVDSTLIVAAWVSEDSVELAVGADDTLLDVLRDRPGVAGTGEAWTR